MSGQVPRGYDQVTCEPALVISVCDLAYEDTAPFPQARRLHWSVPDPTTRSDLEAFEGAFDEIALRIDRLFAERFAHDRL